MSLPISPSLMVRTAEHVVKHVGQTLGFADVLADPKQATAADSAETDFADKDPTQIQAQLIERIQRRFQESGLDLNQPLQLRVETDGDVRVESQHTRAAEMEAILASDAEIRQLAQQWFAAENRSPGASSIDLTIPASTASILPDLGGYPNW